MPNNNGKITKIAWNITRINNSLTEVFVYDAIADKQSVDWWTGEKGTEITPKLFAEELGNVSTPNICIRINSGGGDVFAAEAIRTQIREKRVQGKTVTCKIDGICASAAVGIAAACETISIPSSAYFMIHDPTAFAYGYFNSAEFEKGKKMLDKVKQGIINAYSEKTGKSKQEISDLMTAETWYTGEEAVKNEFCDEVMFEDTKEEETEGEEHEQEETKNVANSGVLNTAMYRNCPTELLNSRTKAAAVYHITNKNKKGVEKSMEIKTVDELREQYPELTAQVAETATGEERKRIQDIENIALPGFEGVINKAKFESPLSAADVAMNMVAEQKKQGAKYLASATEDANNSGVNEVTASGYEGANDKVNPYEAAIDKVLPGKK
ncbi:hypothetical protein FACS1894111_05790 [Clostridia bacterium]|nr:hypothetical protein FACS1894111_05790 [Clostridia bacterium]